MSPKSCFKSVPGSTNIPTNTKQVNPPVTFILLHGIGKRLSSIIKSKWSIGFECPHPVVFSCFRILTICHLYKCNGNISKKTTMTLAFKMLQQMFLHTSLLQLFYLCRNSAVVSPTHCLPHFLHVRRQIKQLYSQLN